MVWAGRLPQDSNCHSLWGGMKGTTLEFQCRTGLSRGSWDPTVEETRGRVTSRFKGASACEPLPRF